MLKREIKEQKKDQTKKVYWWKD